MYGIIEDLYLQCLMTIVFQVTGVCVYLTHTHTNVSVAWSFESPVRKVWKPSLNPSTLLETKLSQHWNSDAI